MLLIYFVNKYLSQILLLQKVTYYTYLHII